jgi:pimeloyl-ACP methyl ester carboxylesterase
VQTDFGYTQLSAGRRCTISEEWKHGSVSANAIKIHYVTSGSGDLVLLLHGFPEFWYSWRHQIPTLSRDFKVVAPDMRGYNESDKPAGVASYSTSLLVQDIKDLIGALGESKAIVVGHDWGGAVAWNLAMMAPEYVKELVILNCPHPLALIQSYQSINLRQLQKSWYVFFFQQPEAPERILSRDNFQFLKMMLLGSAVNKKAFSTEDLNMFVEAWSKPGALTASINYYRANMNPAHIMMMPKEQQDMIPRRFPKVKCPTFVIWGENDAALDRSLTLGMEKYVEGTYEINYIQNCGHWVQQEAPDEVNKYLLDFLKKGKQIAHEKPTA